MINSFIALVGGLGIGSLLTTFVNHLLSKRSEAAERLYREKREAYIGMNRALYESEIEPSDRTEKAFGYYLNVAKIFGASEVIEAGQNLINSKPGSSERIRVLKELHEAMRKDLLR